MIKRNVKSKNMWFLSVLVGLICVGLGAVDEPIGVVASLDGGSIQLIDPVSMSISDNLLRHELGSIGGGLLDVVLTSDAKTAIVSNFGESKIYFIDISGGFNAVPVLKGRGFLPIFAEDMSITPDDKYVMVTDGGLSSRIVVIDMATHETILVKNLGFRDAQSIDITADGKHVLVADYLAGRIHSYDFDSENVTLTYRQSRSTYQGLPVNTASSPDGRTVLVMCNDSGGIIPVFYIDSNGDLCDQGGLAVPNKNFQSAVFTRDGTRAYAISNNANGTYAYELNVLAPGQVTLGNVKQLPGPRGSGQYFGVDTLGLDPSGSYLFVSNPTSFGTKPYLTVLSTETLEPVYVMETFGTSSGIKFGTISHPEEE